VKPLPPSVFPRTAPRAEDEAALLTEDFALDGLDQARQRALETLQDHHKSPRMRRRSTNLALVDALNWVYHLAEIDKAGSARPHSILTGAGLPATLRERRGLIDALCAARAAAVHGQRLPVVYEFDRSVPAIARWVDELPRSERRTPKAYHAFARWLASKSVEETLMDARRSFRASGRLRARAERWRGILAVVWASRGTDLRL